ncbi:MAG: hypothetical protein AB1427_00705 [Thermodesulfobacteriota bacterium]
MSPNRCFIILILSLFIISGCAGTLPNTDINVRVSRHLYSPNLTPSKYAEYNGKIMIFDSVDVSEHPDITNFYYHNKDKTIGYTLFYSPGSMQQPVSSFFWYALQKTFESIGITIKEAGPLKNIPQFHLNILSLTDQEAKLQISLSRNGLLLIQKEIIIFQKLPLTKDLDELEKRQYSYLDLMVETILNDPDFKRDFFSDKANI